jgi:prevent-host-death family protein
MSKVIGVAEAKRHFSEVMVEVAREGKHFIIEKKGKPMVALVNIKDLETIERTAAPSKKKGLLASLGAWEDFNNVEGVVKHIYEQRKTAKERKLKELF